MFKWFFNYWDKTNRITDMQILWPSCKQHATSLDDAKAVFFWHIMNDPAWSNHYDEVQLVEFVDQLT